MDNNDNLFENDDFFIDDDELGEDNQLTLVEKSIENVLTTMKKTIEEALLNLKINSKNDAFSNIRMIAHYTNSLVELISVNEENLSNEELIEIIDKIVKETTELNFSNIDEILKDENETTEIEDINSFDDDSNDNGTDF